MFAANHIAEHFSNDALVAALCDRKKDQLDRAKAAFPDALAFDDFDAFINSGLDAVVLANYFHEHERYAVRALEKGIAVLSETTAAVTHRECVELVETVERTGTKYSLAENYPFSAARLEMKRVYETGKLGKVMYAEGEYCHPSSIEEIRALDPEEYHWRKYAPMTYYITHSLGPLMYMTGALPKAVTARTCYDEGRAERINRKYSDVAAIMLISMDNDAVFRVPACAMFAPHGAGIASPARMVVSKRSAETKAWFDLRMCRGIFPRERRRRSFTVPNIKRTVKRRRKQATEEGTIGSSGIFSNISGENANLILTSTKQRQCLLPRFRLGGAFSTEMRVIPFRISETRRTD
jgi:predicted dehydrogenase